MGAEVAVIMLVVLFSLILLGVHIGIALGLVSGLGIVFITSDIEVALSLISEIGRAHV